LRRKGNSPSVVTCRIVSERHQSRRVWNSYTHVYASEEGTASHTVTPMNANTCACRHAMYPFYVHILCLHPGPILAPSGRRIKVRVSW